MMEAEIKALERERVQAMLAGDVAALDALISDGLVYLHSSGGRDSKASYLAQLRDGTIRYQRIAEPDPEVRLAGDTAVVFGRMDADVVRDGKPLALDYDYLAVWARENGRWRFFVFQPRPAAS
jgi:ketosteroid isomerase-like protein